jgi:hypothetical protein
LAGGDAKISQSPEKLRFWREKAVSIRLFVFNEFSGMMGRSILDGLTIPS